MNVKPGEVRIESDGTKVGTHVTGVRADGTLVSLDEWVSGILWDLFAEDGRARCSLVLREGAGLDVRCQVNAVVDLKAEPDG